MNKLILYYFSFLLFLGMPATAQTAKVDSAGMITLRIDPESARGGAVSQFFDEVEFIPLETTKESLFGKISQLKITEHNYVIYDYDTKSVLIFKKNGKFTAKINATMIAVDDASKETVNFFGFRMVKNNKEDQIMISAAKNFYFFDLNGKLVEKKLAKGYKLDQKYTFSNHSDSVQMNYLKVNGIDSVIYELAFVNDKKEAALYFPYATDRFKYDQFLSGGSTTDRIYKYGVENEFFYLRYYDFNIYKITPNKLNLAYRIIFPAANSLPQDFMTNEIYKNKRIPYFQKNMKVFYGLTDTYKTGNLLFLKMNSMNYNKSDKKALIYNLATSEITSIKDIEPDSLSSYLPITDAGAFNDYQNTGMHLVLDQNFYTSYSSLAMFTFKEQSAGKNPTYNAILSDYFKTQNKKSNPVLIRLKPKKP